MAISYPIIRVFLTKGYKFRAIIQESEKEKPYEVTVNGESWRNGKGRQHKDQVMKKCKNILEKIQDSLK